MATEKENQRNLYELKGKIADAISLIEKELRNMGARGTGIKELVNSLEAKLPNDIKSKVLWCNRIRNRLLHPNKDTGYIHIPTNKEYENFCQNIKVIMNYFTQQKSTFTQKEPLSNEKLQPKNTVVDDLLSALDKAWSNLSLAGKIMTVTGGVVALPLLTFGYYWIREKLDI
ncbi:hypothetical protein [Actinobacillus porcinus]|uniref:hypothetical protein n=1 Tax=Actinobacillus porcinus TaxID=51048 RepID=UPI0023F115D8|nr:hypothetical protein [Actinobacillus porcinus]MDD7544103.1 hypothetical protein [Actinobacillus porcinus]MDY5847371.1 hypothetical protein [Actinobacillus porcinus]